MAITFERHKYLSTVGISLVLLVSVTFVGRASQRLHTVHTCLFMCIMSEDSKVAHCCTRAVCMHAHSTLTYAALRLVRWVCSYACRPCVGAVAVRGGGCYMLVMCAWCWLSMWQLLSSF